jgi:hypothetical protein
LFVSFVKKNIYARVARINNNLLQTPHKINSFASQPLEDDVR